MGIPTLYSQELIDEFRTKGYWNDLTFADAYNQRASETPDKEAIVDSKARFTWLEVKQWTDRIALRLLSLGYQKDDVIVVQLPNWAELVLYRIACEKAGVVSMAVPWALRHKEIKYIVSAVNAMGIVIPREFHRFDFYKMVQEIRPRLSSLKHVFVVGNDVPSDTISVKEMAESPKELNNSPDALEKTKFGAFEYSWIQLTTGSTGFPKFVEAPICGKIYAGKMFQSACNVTAEDVCGIFTLGPVGPNILSSTATPLVGAKIALLERFEPEKALAFIEKEKISIVGIVPTMLAKMIESPNFESYDLSSLRAVLVTGSPLLPNLAIAAEDKIGSIIQYYGAVDFGGITLPYTDTPREVRLFTANKLCPGTQAKLLDENGEEVESGEQGELAVRGPICNSGFYKDPQATWKIWTKDAWFRTGDRAVFDENGVLVIVGRLKDVIIRGGQNINPTEIENLLIEHSAITNVAVVGMPDTLMGERACAYVSLNEGDTLSFDEMVDYLKKKNIAAFKFPERLEILKQLPLVPGSGKVNKKLLREEIAEKLQIENQTEDLGKVP